MNEEKVHGNKGRKMSQETKDKIAATRRGKKMSDEAREKISAAKRGVPKSAEHREAISAGCSAYQQKVRELLKKSAG